MAAKGLGLRKSAKSRAKSSTQTWSPNSRQAAEDQSGFVDVLVSERDQQSSSSGLTLPQQNQQAGTLTQSASSLDQLQNGLVQPAGNNETSLVGDDLNSNVIVNAQLTHLVSRDDAAQGQDAPNAPDVPSSSSSNPSFIKASENEVHLFQERHSSRGQNLGYHFWMTDVQKTLHSYSHF